MKVNLTVIDKNPDIKNFVYPGLNEECVKLVKNGFLEGSRVIEFTYDEGFVMISTSEIHSIVVSDYISNEDIEEPPVEEA